MEGEVVTMQEIFKFERHGVDGNGKIRGRFMATGIRSKFADRFTQWGYDLPQSLFRPEI
jgi:pilus assembly protein CpaF